MKITIGKSGTRNIQIDLDILLRTRLLIQANSGGGKSYLLRRLAEQLSGHIPVIIIDPEGEFATLREKFSFVLVGKGGETPADPRSASLVAHKLLELRASAVCDLYEMKPHERHHWVSLFVDAITNAPKNLWRPTVIITDEVHTFCPQKGSGESEAREAMVGSATRWRKRQFCPIWATQRLAKVDKDASAEMLNRLIGPTFEDVDLKRAAELLSVRSEDRREFDQQMRTLEPGNFFALGRAICLERTLVRIGEVQTSHELHAGKYDGTPPPAPESIAKLLPKLSDLPKQAEEKAKTETELRTEIRSLKAQLRTQPQPQDTGKVKELETLVAALNRHIGKMEDFISAQATTMGRAIKELEHMCDENPPDIESKTLQPIVKKHIPAGSSFLNPKPYVAQTPQANGDLTGPQRKILNALGELLSIGKDAPPKSMVAAWAAYSVNGSAFTNPLSALKSAGYVSYPSPGVVALTQEGTNIAPPPPAPEREEILRRIESICTGPEWKIFKATLNGDVLTRPELAERSGYSEGGSAFTNPLSALKTKGLVNYPQSGSIKVADWLLELF